MSEPIAPPVNPNRSPSYPQRVHIRERGQWNAVLAQWEAKIAAARQSSGTPDEKTAMLLAQMSGARDQIADAARRLPMEVGHMYEEDREKLEEAVAALGRLFAKWEALS